MQSPKKLNVSVSLCLSVYLNTQIVEHASRLKTRVGAASPRRMGYNKSSSVDVFLLDKIECPRK